MHMIEGTLSRDAAHLCRWDNDVSKSVSIFFLLVHYIMKMALPRLAWNSCDMDLLTGLS